MSYHNAFAMYVHITWSTWNRVGCIDEEVAEDVRKAAGMAARRTGDHILRIAVLADHVHVILSLRPSSRVSDFIRVAKSGSAFMANQRVPGQLKWSRGANVATICRRDLRDQIAYVAAQFLHHPDRIPKQRRVHEPRA
jgi:REP element-mobilizing transposase RayT